MFPGFFVVPFVFAVAAFLHEWNNQVENGNEFPMTIIVASKSALATFVFCLVVVAYMGNSMTPA